MPADDVRWKEIRTKHFVLKAIEGTFGEQVLSLEGRSAERSLHELNDLLEPSATEVWAPLEILVVDMPPIDGVIGGLGIINPARSLRIVSPEGSFPPMAWIVASFALQHWYGPRILGSQEIVEGVGVFVAAKTQTGPDLESFEESLRDLGKEQAVSLLTERSGVSSDPADDLMSAGAAGSFIRHLIDRFGIDSFRDYVQRFAQAPGDPAAIAVYQRPLPTLREEWADSQQRRSPRASPWKQLAGYVRPLIRPYGWRLAELFTYMLLGLSYTLGIPLASKYLIDEVLPEGNGRKLAIFIAILLVMYIYNSALSVRTALVSSGLNLSILMALQDRMFRRLQLLSHDFYSRTKIGDIMTRLSDDLLVVQQAMSELIGQGASSILSFVGASVALILIDPFLSLVVLPTLIGIAAIYRTLGPRLGAASYEQQERVAETQSFLQESLSGQALIKAFGREDRAVAGFRSRLSTLYRSMMRLVTLNGVFGAGVGLATALPQLLIMGLGGYWVMTRRLSLGDLIAFLGLLPSVLSPISALSGLGQEVQEASGSLARVSELLDEPISVDDSVEAIEMQAPEREIRFENVSLSYSPDRLALQEISLSIPIGKKVAIVGPSGSGKSSVVNLLLRFWDADAGRVMFDENDTRISTISSLRQQVGVVMQDTFIFSTTLRENIAFALPDASDEEISQAASAAQLDELISGLPMGLDTPLGEAGGRLSGGQRQRVGIARVVLRDSPIIVLDEATSALDAHAEKKVLEALKDVAKHRTTIMITHRLASAMDADRIFVLDRGRLVQEGTHASLMSTGGLYKSLFEEQNKGHSRADDFGLIDQVSLLKRVPLLASLDEETLVALSSHATTATFKPGDKIVRQGDPADRLCLLRSGEVQVSISAQEHETPVRTLFPGDYFGEVALVSGGRRTATVTAVSDAQVISIDGDAFNRLLSQESSTAKAVAQAVEHRIATYKFAAEAISGAQNFV